MSLMSSLKNMVDKIIPSEERQRVEKPAVSQEFAVIGLGRFGASVALTLVGRGFTVLGIDKDPVLAQRYADEITQTISLDSTDEDALREIDISSYDAVVVAIGAHFEENVMTTVALKALGVRQVVCKAGTLRQEEILYSVGADRVVLPEFEAGKRIAQQLAKPGIVDQIVIGPVHRISKVIVPVSMTGHTLEDLNIDKRFGVKLLATVRDESVTMDPPPYYLLREGDFFVVYGHRNDLDRLSRA